VLLNLSKHSCDSVKRSFVPGLLEKQECSRGSFDVKTSCEAAKLTSRVFWDVEADLRSEILLARVQKTKKKDDAGYSWFIRVVR